MRRPLEVIKYFNTFARALLLVLVIISAMQDYKTQAELLLLLLTLCALMIVGEVLAHLSLFKNRPVPIWSTALLYLTCAAVFVINRQNTACMIYYFFLPHDALYIKNKKVRFGLLVYHFFIFCLYCFLSIFREAVSRSPGKILLSLLFNMSVYVGVLFIEYSVHYYKSERERLETLNNDLIDYSFHERNYLLSSERNKISQQLHDSIGHSLVAVLWNIRYLKGINDTDPAVRLKELEAIEALIKESIESLRASVDNLKRLDDKIDLHGEIEKLASRFNRLGVVDIQLHYDEAIDNAPNGMKNILHENIREGITNSLRHGDANKIEIRLIQSDNHIELFMKDNGRGCDNIIKSSGLNGILERVKSVNGEAYFISKKGKGFEMRNLIPWEVCI